MASTISQDRQSELESRAGVLARVQLEAGADLGKVFGSATEWVMELGPFRFLLIPFLGEWWFYDEAHGEWRFTGKKIGEARFLYDGTALQIADSGSGGTAGFPAAANAAAASGRHFCPACGARVQPQWKFCDSCGGKLS